MSSLHGYVLSKNVQVNLEYFTDDSQLKAPVSNCLLREELGKQHERDTYFPYVSFCAFMILYCA